MKLFKHRESAIERTNERKKEKKQIESVKRKWSWSAVVCIAHILVSCCAAKDTKKDILKEKKNGRICCCRQWEMFSEAKIVYYKDTAYVIRCRIGTAEQCWTKDEKKNRFNAVL